MLILARESCAWCLVGQYIENLGGQNIASSRFWNGFPVITQVRPPQRFVCLFVCSVQTFQCRAKTGFDWVASESREQPVS